MGRLKTVEWIEKIQIAELFSLGGGSINTTPTKLSTKRDDNP